MNTVPPQKEPATVDLICKHMNYINPMADPKYNQEKFKKFISDNKIKRVYNQFGHEMYQHNPEEWICLHDGCDSVFLKQHQDNFTVLRHYENITNEEDNHYLFINCQTAVIRCISCDVEIYDLEMQRQLGVLKQFEYTPDKQEEQKNWANPRKIRDIFHSMQFDWDSNLLQQQKLYNFTGKIFFS